MIYEVLSPLGEPGVKAKSSAPRLSDLNGKTLCEVSDGLFEHDVSFPIIRELLQKQYPSIKIIPYTELPKQPVEGGPAHMFERAEAAVALAKQKGCDAAIVGNGF